MKKLQVNKTQVNYNNLQKLMEELNRNISIKVGLLGKEGSKRVEGTDLSQADLGAIHEFGATINHPGGTPYTINEDGTAQFVSKDKGAKLPKTQPHTIVIPTRSFLRMPLLSSDGKRKLTKKLRELMSTNKELNKINLTEKPKHLTLLAEWLGVGAVQIVQEAFATSGFGNWKDVTPATRARREGDSNNPPLEDTGNLKKSIEWKVEER